MKDKISERLLQKLWSAVLYQTVRDALDNRNECKFIRFGQNRYKYIDGKLKWLSPFIFNAKSTHKLCIDDARIFFLYPGNDLDFVCDAANFNKQKVLDSIVPKILQQVKREKDDR